MGEAMSGKDLTLEAISDLRLEDAERYREELLEEINAIDAQLGSSTRTFEDGSTYSEQEYQHWRRRAIDAKRHILRNYRALKRHCSDLVAQAAVARTQLDLDDPVQLVHALTGLLHNFKSQGVEFDREEVDLLIAADHFVKHNPL